MFDFVCKSVFTHETFSTKIKDTYSHLRFIFATCTIWTASSKAMPKRQQSYRYACHIIIQHVQVCRWKRRCRAMRFFPLNADIGRCHHPKTTTMEFATPRGAPHIHLFVSKYCDLLPLFAIGICQLWLLSSLQCPKQNGKCGLPQASKSHPQRRDVVQWVWLFRGWSSQSQIACFAHCPHVDKSSVANTTNCTDLLHSASLCKKSHTGPKPCDFCKSYVFFPSVGNQCINRSSSFAQANACACDAWASYGHRRMLQSTVVDVLAVVRSKLPCSSVK